MGCGWTYKGAARYRLGPAYLHQQSEQLRASAVHNNPGPSVNLDGLSVRKSRFPYQGSNVIQKNDTFEALNTHYNRKPAQEEPNLEIMREERARINKQSEMARTDSVYESKIPQPPMKSLDQTSRKVESRDSPELKPRNEFPRYIHDNSLIRPSNASNQPPGRMAESIVTSIAGGGFPFRPTPKQPQYIDQVLPSSNHSVIKNFDYTKTMKQGVL